MKAFLEESYFFTESRIEYQPFLNTTTELQNVIRQIVHQGTQNSITTGPKQPKIAKWLQSALHGADHRITLIQNEIHNLIYPYTIQVKHTKLGLSEGKKSEQYNNPKTTFNHREKRFIERTFAPLEFLSNINEAITGGPSASSFRQVVDATNQLTAQGLMQGKILHGITAIQHEFQSILTDLTNSNSKQIIMLKDLSKTVSLITTKQATEIDLTQKSLALLSCTDTLILQGNHLLNRISATLLAGDFYQKE